LETILTRPYDFPKFQQARGDFKYIVGQGLVLSEGNTHRRQRKMMNPAFTHINIKVCTVDRDECESK